MKYYYSVDFEFTGFDNRKFLYVDTFSCSDSENLLHKINAITKYENPYLKGVTKCFAITPMKKLECEKRANYLNSEYSLQNRYLYDCEVIDFYNKFRN